jgi:hypothetical protein
MDPSLLSVVSFSGMRMTGEGQGRVPFKHMNLGVTMRPDCLELSRQFQEWKYGNMSGI